MIVRSFAQKGSTFTGPRVCVTTLQTITAIGSYKFCSKLFRVCSTNFEEFLEKKIIQKSGRQGRGVLKGGGGPWKNCLFFPLISHLLISWFQYTRNLTEIWELKFLVTKVIQMVLCKLLRNFFNKNKLQFLLK